MTLVLIRPRLCSGRWPESETDAGQRVQLLRCELVVLPGILCLGAWCSSLWR